MLNVHSSDMNFMLNVHSSDKSFMLDVLFMLNVGLHSSDIHFSVYREVYSSV